MPLILDRKQVLDVFSEANERKWTLPAFNAENLTTIEAILESTKKYGEKIGNEELPIIIGITNNYKDRPQSAYYTHTRKWDIGLRLFLSDISVLTSAESPYGKLKVLIFLDHIQLDEDKELLEWDMSQFSGIMFDASKLPIEKNIKKTAAFVEKNKDKIVIEGACDEIASKGHFDKNELTTPELAERYFKETGVDIIVANLGTEHRASAAELKYHGDLARKIKERIGNHICLHGTSSVPTDKLGELFEDGICKVNIWTTLERDSIPELFEDMLLNVSKIVGVKKAQKLLAEKLIGENADTKSELSLDYFTTKYRQDFIFQKMQNIINKYLELWYI